MENQIQEEVQTQTNESDPHQSKNETPIINMEQIFNNAGEGMRIIDQNFDIIKANKAFLDIAQLEESEVLGSKCYDHFTGSLCNTDRCPMHRIKNGEERIEYETTRTRHDGVKVPCIVTATPIRNQQGEITNILEIYRDITAQKEAEWALKESSIPLQQIWDDILMLPIVGPLDSIRAQEMMDKILMNIQETKATVCILDILGVPSVDSAVANHIIKITRATKLMGCECIISGIGSTVAQTMVNIGVDMGTIVTTAKLEDALQLALKKNNITFDK